VNRGAGGVVVLGPPGNIAHQAFGNVDSKPPSTDLNDVMTPLLVLFGLDLLNVVKLEESSF